MIIDWRCNKKPSLVGKCVGAIAGLATITPAAGFVQPWAAFAIGIIASTVCYLCCEIRKKFNIDDALDVWGVHGMGGFIGTILVGALADPASCLDADPATNLYCVNPGSVARSWSQLGKQTAAAFFCAAYSFVVTVAILKIIGMMMRVVPSKEEQADLDFRLHGEQARPPPKTSEAQRRECAGDVPGILGEKDLEQQAHTGSTATVDSHGDSTSDSDESEGGA
jgi:Amt family ammonium transporter